MKVWTQSGVDFSTGSTWASHKKAARHEPFLRAGIPSVFFFGGLHDDYHLPVDDVEKILPEKVSNVARLAFLTSWFLANENEPSNPTKAPAAASDSKR